MSLQFYPHENEDVRVKRFAPPEGMEADGGILFPVAVIDLVLVAAFVSCAGAGNIAGMLIALGLAAGINAFALIGN